MMVTDDRGWVEESHVVMTQTCHIHWCAPSVCDVMMALRSHAHPGTANTAQCKWQGCHHPWLQPTGCATRMMTMTMTRRVEGTMCCVVAAWRLQCLAWTHAHSYTWVWVIPLLWANLKYIYKTCAGWGDFFAPVSLAKYNGRNACWLSISWGDE